MSKKEEKKKKNKKEKKGEEDTYKDSDGKVDEDPMDKLAQTVFCVLAMFLLILVMFIVAGIGSAVLYFRMLKPEEKTEDFVFSESVTVLEAEDFEVVLAEGSNAMVMFFAPWCGHCKRSKPIFSELGEVFVDRLVDTEHNTQEPVTIAALNCEEKKYQKKCRELQVESYPTFMLWRNGKWKKHEGERSVVSFQSFIETAFGPRIHRVNDASDSDLKILFDKFPDKTIILGSLGPDFHEIFASVSDLLEDDLILAERSVTNEEEEKLVIYPPEDRENVKTILLSSNEDWKDINNIESLKEEILYQGYPLVEEYTWRNAKRYKKEGKLVLVSFVDNEDDMYYIKPILEELAEQSRREFFVTCWGDVRGFVYKLMISFSGASLEYPEFMVFDEVEELNYLYEGDVTVDHLYDWISQIKDGEVESFYRSEEIPDEFEDERFGKNVRTLVGKSFKKFILETGSPSVVLLGNEEELKDPSASLLLDKLAQTYLRDGLMIGAIDAVRNDFPPSIRKEMEIRPIPKLLFFDGVEVKPKEDIGNPFEGADGDENLVFERVAAKIDELLGKEKKIVGDEQSDEL